MGTAICHPLNPSDLSPQCNHCISNCLPQFTSGNQVEQNVNTDNRYGLPTTSDTSTYVLTIGQPKIEITECYLDTQNTQKVASTPDNKTAKDDSTLVDRRGYDRSKSNSPTDPQSQSSQSCPINGQVSNQGSLTIVRRSSGRKGNSTTANNQNTAITEQQQSLSSTNQDQLSLPKSQISSQNEDSQNILTTDSSNHPSTSNTDSNTASYHCCESTALVRTIDYQQSHYHHHHRHYHHHHHQHSQDYLNTDNTIDMQALQATDSSTADGATSAAMGISTTGSDNLDTIDLATDNLPAVDTPDACDKAAVRLRCLLRLLQRGEISAEVLQKNLHYAARVLEAVFLDETKSPNSIRKQSLKLGRKSDSLDSIESRLADEDDELSEVQPDAVPPEVREWLASTFTRQLATTRKKSDEKPKFRSVAHAIRAGIFVDRIYRRVSSTALMQFPPEVVKVLKTLDEWSFDVFALAEAANGQPVKYLGYDLLNRYGMIHKFKVPPVTLETFLNRIEEGYCRFRNPYHNNLHAADVAQTVHHVLCQTGLMNWMSDLEIFATLLAAIIHDYEHTGTTNNFHVMSGSETAMLYNDRAVLENHHISAAFRVLREDECNVLSNLSREEYRELRSLIIDMVLATDMSYHFQQLKNMKNLLTLAEPSVDKSKALSLVLHCCDISHPAKKWSLHHRWTMLLLEEFFRQGDLERELGLPFSPLCDRNNTLVAESQIGFIEFIVEPSMQVCSDMLEYILAPIAPITATNTSSSCKNVESSDGASSSSLTNKTCEAISEEVEVTKNGSSSSSLNVSGGNDGGDGSSNTNTNVGGQSSGNENNEKDKFRIRKPWVTCLAENKKIWKEQAVKDAEARATAAAITENEEEINPDNANNNNNNNNSNNTNVSLTPTTTTAAATTTATTNESDDDLKKSTLND